MTAFFFKGRVVIVALHEQPVDFSPLHLIVTEKTLTGALAYANDYEPVLQRCVRRLAGSAARNPGPQERTALDVGARPPRDPRLRRLPPSGCTIKRSCRG